MTPATPLYLLDTNILIHYARRDTFSQRIEDQYHLLTTSTVPLISDVTGAEVGSFAVQNQWGSPRREQLGFLLTLVTTVPIDRPGIRDAYIAIDVYSRERGIKMGKNDLWIAATASATGATLLTTDRDFDHLNGPLLTGERIVR